jgi:hypothetical protein
MRRLHSYGKEDNMHAWTPSPRAPEQFAEGKLVDALEAEQGRSLMLDDGETGLRDALAGRVQSEEEFRASLRHRSL